MAELETFVDLHDSLVNLLGTMDRRSLVERLCRVIGLTLPANVVIEERTPVAEVPALGKHRKKRIADLVLEVRTQDRRAIVTFVIEVQESYSHAKGRDWMIFAVAFADRHVHKAQVMIFTPKPELRRRIRRLVAQIDEPIHMFEPDHIERIDDDDIARAQPHDTILGALFHAGETDTPEELRVASVRAALVALVALERLEQVDPSQWLSYFGLIMSTAPPAIGERALELAIERGSIDAERVAANWEFWRGGTLHEWSKREGREEGREEGRVETLRLVITELLAFRDSDTDEWRARLERCDDPTTLERWFRGLASSDPSVELTRIFD